MPARRINITLGTAGHIDHGKTALVKNLTGCDTDRLKEEKERGMSIELGFAPCVIEDLQIGIVDVPGHENFIKTMVAGAVGMDGVILVVAADDGIMPQTREHLDILTLLGIRHGLVALTKSDRVDPERLSMVTAEVHNFLKNTFLENAPIIPVSNITGEGLAQLREALKSLIGKIEPRNIDGLFRMPIERTFSVKGYGTVVTGNPVSGSAAIEDELVLLPQNQTGRIKSIQVYKHRADRVLAGECTAINVRQWDHTQIKRGDVVTVPDYFTAANWFLCKVRLLPSCHLKNGSSLKFHTGTTEAQAKVYLFPECDDFIQIFTASPLVAGPRDRFILRSLTPPATIGGGEIVEPLPRRMKRHQPNLTETLSEWSAAIHDDSRFAEYVLKTAPTPALTVSDIAHRTKFSADRLRNLLSVLTDANTILALPPNSYLHQATAQREESRLINLVSDYHRTDPQSPGLTREELLAASALTKNVFDLLLARLLKNNSLADRNGRLALPSHQETIPPEDKILFDRIDTIFRTRLFDPPGEEELIAVTLADPGHIKKVIKLLLDRNRLIRLPENRLFHQEAVTRAREILIAYIKKEGRLESVKFKYLLNTTRKFALPLLDHFDRIGLTRRINNTRYLKPS